MPAQQAIPVYTSLDQVFQTLGDSVDHAARWNDLAKGFEERFGRKPAYIARAPGRVNLIGEHIDYMTFGVLPAAVERDILIACAPRIASEPEADEPRETHHAPGSVVADNLHGKYARQVFAPVDGDGSESAHVAGWHLDIDTKQLRWESYVKAGYYGVLDHYFKPADGEKVSTNAHPVPVDLLVTGSVPAGSGLSSSAAMVVASTLAFLAVNGKLDDSVGADVPHINKGKLVEMAMENEKRVGVNSGGMDQAASALSMPGSALFINFWPELKAEQISLPPGAVFVCANSLIVADKVVTAKTNYNLRVVETLVAARVLAKRMGVNIDSETEGLRKATLREVAWKGVSDGASTMEANQLMRVLVTMLEEKIALLGESPLTMEEMIDASGLKKEEFDQVYLSWVEVEASHFKLFARTKHVFSEALRVLLFREVCVCAALASSATTTLAGYPSRNSSTYPVPSFEDMKDGPKVLTELGRLMNESQKSCDQDFQCSCPELNELTALARASGAYGSRLTGESRLHKTIVCFSFWIVSVGAGWGGCTVSLVAEDQVDSFIAKMKAGYKPYNHLDAEALAEVIFATKPSSGACVYKFEE